MFQGQGETAIIFSWRYYQYVSYNQGKSGEELEGVVLSSAEDECP